MNAAMFVEDALVPVPLPLVLEPDVPPVPLVLEPVPLVPVPLVPVPLPLIADTMVSSSCMTGVMFTQKASSSVASFSI